jgi:hypothetical protein
MLPEELTIGTKVVVNGRNPTYQGKRGEVRYISGSLYWLRFEDGTSSAIGFNCWMLDPAPAMVGAGRGRR